jgi:hypothetical protein
VTDDCHVTQTGSGVDVHVFELGVGPDSTVSTWTGELRGVAPGRPIRFAVPAAAAGGVGVVEVVGFVEVVTLAWPSF